MRAKTVNEEVIEGSIWRLASQKWLKEFIDNEGFIDHKHRFISFSFDNQAGGQDNFGGGEVIIEFDAYKILKQGEEQGYGEVYYEPDWMEAHPDICEYSTGYRTKEDYFDTLDQDEPGDWDWREHGWEIHLQDFEHEQEIVLKQLNDEDGLIKSIAFNKPADISLVNRLKRKNILYKLKAGLENDPQQKLFK
jgi:hypothetical protein